MLVRFDFCDHALTFRAEIAADLIEEMEDEADFAQCSSLS
jgi:hypothetical protein